ncbi:carbon-nitrogen hydrolase family protein [Inquilinus limosus]|uniref:carbon-nitrogen hydrolase family protein n=1 Tax=Inquilinus limosus TaxID=171674 RepID=UPI003F15F466
MTVIRAACIQLNVGPDVGPNLAAAGDLIRDAAGRGATLVVLPEVADAIIEDPALLRERAQPEERHEALAGYRALARETGMTLLVGSAVVRTDGPRFANRSYLLGPDGAILARYDKIHLYDADLPDGEVHRESAQFAPGGAGVVAALPGGGRLGLTICYDLRFPQLHRALAKAGAEILAVPAAFACATGAAHWEVLLRARAIETGCFVLAPAQTGTHHLGRRTWGHSLIVSPWGEVLADAGTEVGVIMADLDLDRVRAARAALPSLSHDRAFEIVGAVPA